MTEREAPAAQRVTILCVECGELIEVKDPAALIHALHLLNECSVSSLVAKE